MARAASYSTGTELGCGFMGGIFHLRRTYFHRKPSVPSLPTIDDPNKAQDHNSERPKSAENKSKSAKPPTRTGQKLIKKKPTSVHPNPPISHQKNQTKKPSDASRTSTSSSNCSKPDEHKLKNSKALVQAPRRNVIISGQLGNLRQLRKGHSRAVHYLQDHKHCYGVMGNIVTNKLDPEAVKSMGNEAYKKGSFEEALALYNRAITLDSRNATYRSNKSAALIGLGRFIEAVSECKEAIRIDPSHHRAHHRLSNLYLRLGEPEKALYHYDQLGSASDSKDISKAQSLHKHITRCNHARRFKKWSELLEETQYASSTGADSAPQVYAMQVEALVNLHRHHEAYAIFQKRPSLDIDSCTKLFGLAKTAYLLMVASLVYLTAGRFEDAVGAAQDAARLDPSNEEASMVVKKARAVSSARMSGNLLFKEAKFSEACSVYSEGLQHDRYNSVLLCNRAACRAKLGEFEKAVEDCTAALSVQPCYDKARLRRAHCNAKMGKWEASIQDYEMLERESLGDDEVEKGLFEARVQLRRQRGEETEDIKVCSNLVVVSDNKHFRHLVASPGMSVVLFCNQTKQKQVLKPMQQVCKRFPSVNFLKVEVEEHPHLAKSEGVSSIPAFKIYKNGMPVKELPGNNCELLESSVRVYSS